MKKSHLGNVAMDIFNIKEGLCVIESRLINKKKAAIYFLNAHCYNIAQRDNDYREIINRADFLLNDGFGIRLGAKLFGIQLKENLNGTDFIPMLLQLASEKEYSVFLLGAGPGVAELAKQNIQAVMPNIKIVGQRSGYFSDEENQEVIQQINDVSPDILIVGRGVPIQEKWIDRNKDTLDARVILGVGAYIDFASGRIPRAPKLIRTLKMEWVFRLMLEPRRMWRRYLIGNFQFFYYTVKNKLLVNQEAEIPR